MDDNAASREERVPVAIHQHALHGGLREPRPLRARTAHAGGFARPAQPEPALRAACTCPEPLRP
uniref:Uncharacterized protein n=1 Tax=Malurus cyaneus samueli TaxID=2593467 RepID=A0A8C5T912_9PASS